MYGSFGVFAPHDGGPDKNVWATKTACGTDILVCAGLDRMIEVTKRRGWPTDPSASSLHSMTAQTRMSGLQRPHVAQTFLSVRALIGSRGYRTTSGWPTD